jgi:hypothetical protein
MSGNTPKPIKNIEDKWSKSMVNVYGDDKEKYLSYFSKTVNLIVQMVSANTFKISQLGQ